MPDHPAADATLAERLRESANALRGCATTRLITPPFATIAADECDAAADALDAARTPGPTLEQVLAVLKNELDAYRGTRWSLHNEFVNELKPRLNALYAASPLPPAPEPESTACETCNGTGKQEAYRGEPSQGTEWITCTECKGLPSPAPQAAPAADPEPANETEAQRVRRICGDPRRGVYMGDLETMVAQLSPRPAETRTIEERLAAGERGIPKMPEEPKETHREAVPAPAQQSKGGPVIHGVEMHVGHGGFASANEAADWESVTAAWPEPAACVTPAADGDAKLTAAQTECARLTKHAEAVDEDIAFVRRVAKDRKLYINRLLAALATLREQRDALLTAAKYVYRDRDFRVRVEDSVIDVLREAIAACTPTEAKP